MVELDNLIRSSSGMIEEAGLEILAFFFIDAELFLARSQDGIDDAHDVSTDRCDEGGDAVMEQLVGCDSQLVCAFVAKHCFDPP